MRLESEAEPGALTWNVGTLGGALTTMLESPPLIIGIKQCAPGSRTTPLALPLMLGPAGLLTTVCLRQVFVMALGAVRLIKQVDVVLRLEAGGPADPSLALL